MTAVPRPAFPCNGAPDCQARLHWHGCLADDGKAKCTDPDAHLCGTSNLRGKTCQRDPGHEGSHIAFEPNGTWAWGGFES